MISRMKELEDETRRPNKMKLEEKPKAEIVAQMLEKKWGVHVADVRWTNTQRHR